MYTYKHAIVFPNVNCLEVRYDVTEVVCLFSQKEVCCSNDRNLSWRKRIKSPYYIYLTSIDQASTIRLVIWQVF